MRLLLALLALILGIAPAAAEDLTLDAATNYTIDVSINGRPARLRVDPETSGYIILNPDAVARIGLRRSMIGSRTAIGPVRLNGFSKVAEVRIGNQTSDRRIVWIDRRAVEGADGLIGPADMPYDRVVFAIGPSAPNEREYETPMLFDRGMGLYLPLRFGEPTIGFQFSLIKDRTMATAAAGSVLAAAYGGSWSGPVESQLIEFEVERPVRAMTLATPVPLGPLTLGQLFVRTQDDRGANSLPTDDVDPDEIVVTASGRQRARFNLTIGRDWLGRCSRLEWDNPSRSLRLSCLPEASAR